MNKINTFRPVRRKSELVTTLDVAYYSVIYIYIQSISRQSHFMHKEYNFLKQHIYNRMSATAKSVTVVPTAPKEVALENVSRDCGGDAGGDICMLLSNLPVLGDHREQFKADWCWWGRVLATSKVPSSAGMLGWETEEWVRFWGPWNQWMWASG